MRHSLVQLLAAPSGRGEASAACSLPAEAVADEATGDAEDALLLPAGLELDEWLEAAVAEAREAEPARPGSQRLKAAAAARLNRQRKKQYVQGLESRLQGLCAENRQLRDRNRGLSRRLRRLEREAGYLRAVLANQSALGRLLSRLAGDGLRVGSSLFQDPAAAAAEEPGPPCEGESSSSSSSSDHDYARPVPEEEDDGRGAASSSTPAGICLHVDRDQLSVEFCSLCARRAASSAPLSAFSFAAKIFSFRCLPCQAPLCRG
ncbi:CREB/ATF bZIP transcription factor [Tiliqua scincoides]|uniref:CREB/ATF bZIP transcription factor n=1 Tax=Tiliqua scincoides TaxID=71010 RepID=UPI003462D076